MELCKKYPYVEFKLPAKKGKAPVFLEEQDIQKILDYIPFNEKLQHIKDLFVFQIL